jgi:triacylglycerol lipase
VAVLTVVAVCSVVSTSVAGAATREAKKQPLARDPVLLVHGFNGSAKGWDAFRDRLLAAGYRDDQIEGINYDSDQTIPAIAEQVHQAADDLMARTGRKRIDVVSHSMGAISSRYYVEELGGDRHVDAWVSLAGANNGTYTAYACLLFLSCNDMKPGSDVLTMLARDLRTDGSVRFGAWWSPCDMIIEPIDAAQLPGARNVQTSCLDHGAIISDPTVLAQVATFLKQPHARAA